ncbi:MAG: hypothetical protein Q4G59_13240, partial [Planctomycetia bacterium]|nr:hypothetical protein [Planctomycetia bacterium]
MTPIDPSTLPGLSAPFWFVQLFKILGFVLHCIPMSLWFVGLPMALFLYMVGRRNARRYAGRLISQMPIIMAIGINFGIVPLLFVQAAYYKAFYTSTILMAVHWFFVLVLVGIAYYAIYGCAASLNQSRTRRLMICGLVAVFCLTGCSLIFTSQWTFMALPDAWLEVFAKKSVAGAATGLGTWWRDPVVYLRWCSMIGLGFTTLAFWTLFDSWVLCRARSFVSESDSAGGSSKKKSSGSTAAGGTKLSKKDKRRLKQTGGKSDDSDQAGDDSEEIESEIEESVDSIENYRRWALTLGTCFSWFGLLLAGGSLWFYYYRCIKPTCPDLDYLFTTSWKYLPIGTICSFALLPVLMTLGKWEKIRGVLLVLLVTVSELAVLAAYATTRQFIQNGQLASWLNVAAIPENVEWSPLYVFLGVFAFTLLVILWMIRQMVIAGRVKS